MSRHKLLNLAFEGLSFFGRGGGFCLKVTPLKLGIGTLKHNTCRISAEAPAPKDGIESPLGKVELPLSTSVISTKHVSMQPITA